MARLSSASSAHKTIIEFSDFRPGSAIAFMFNLQPNQDAACTKLRQMMAEKDDQLEKIVKNLRLSHL